MEAVHKIEVADLKQQATGRWLGIYQLLAPELGAAIARQGRHVPCPIHGGTDGFRLFADAAETGGAICATCGAFHDGLALLQALKGWSFLETLKEVADTLVGSAMPAPKPGGKRNRRRMELAARERAKALRWALRNRWREGRRDGPAQRLVQRYLADRGIAPAMAELWMKQARVHPSLPYRDDSGDIIGRWPCIMTLFRDANGKAVTAHRTWLEPDTGGVSKAPLSSPRKLYPSGEKGALSGGAFRLGNPIGTTLGIAEGIETALAVTAATGMTTWACYSASLMPQFQPPKGINSVVIWADKDRSEAGLQAARKLQRRLWAKGVRAAIQLPPKPIANDAKSVDWADVFALPSRPGSLSLMI